MGFSFIEHPSDMIVLAKNKTLETALEDVANGMFTQMGTENADESDSFELSLSAPTKEQLVVQLLTDIIGECETRPLTPKIMKVTSLDYNTLSISVRVYGKKAVPENIIKAVTFHGLRVEEKSGNWEIEVLFDI